MAPKLTQFRDMMSISEAFKPGTLVPDPERFLYTSFSFVEKDNTVYFGQLYKRKLQISLDEFSQGLVRVPDGDIYPLFPTESNLTVAALSGVPPDGDGDGEGVLSWELVS